jgi:hypothetical protein
MSRQQISILWSMPLHTHRGYVLVRSKRRVGANTMTDKKSVADKVRDHGTTDRHHAHPAPDRPSWAAAIMHRWPTWLAIALAALTVGGSSTVEGLADVLPMLAFFYLAAVVLQRRQATWLVAVVVVAAFAALRLQDWIDPVVAFSVTALALVLWGAVRGQLWRGALVVEMAGMVGFTAIALAAVSIDPDLGRYIVAAGWFGHAAWDFAHFRADKVVSRSFAEWCTVFDVLRAVGILILPMP